MKRDLILILASILLGMFIVGVEWQMSILNTKINNAILGVIGCKQDAQRLLKLETAVSQIIKIIKQSQPTGGQ